MLRIVVKALSKTTAAMSPDTGAAIPNELRRRLKDFS